MNVLGSPCPLGAARSGPGGGRHVRLVVLGAGRHGALAQCLALTLLVALATISGCGVRGVPKDVIFGVAAQPNSMDPLAAPDIYSRWATELVYDGLVDINDRLEVIPALASSWQSSDDGLRWDFALRRDVRWHDGTSLTSADVRRTYEAILDPAAAVTLPRSDFLNIARVENPDEWTVRLTLRQPDASLLTKLTVGIAKRSTVATTPKLASAGAAGDLVGTGPFVLQEWLSGDRLVFAANRDYYGGAPGVDRLIWQVVPNESSLVVLLQNDGNGGIDGGLVEEPLDADRLAAAGNVRAYPVPGGNVQVSFRVSDPLFEDARVRRALALAVDRPSMIAGLLGGRGLLSAGDIAPTSWAYSPAAAALNPHDPGQARALLAEAGWLPGSGGILVRDGKRLAFTLSTDAGSQLRREVALTLRQDWQAIGAAVELEFVERNAFVVERVLKGQFQAALLQSSVRADPDLSRRFHSRAIAAGQNFLAYANPALDALLDQALLVSTPAARAVLYGEAQMLLGREVPQINLFYPTTYYLVRADIGGIRPSAMGPFWNVEEWGR
jgi:peptide/nickel transport system substrate-binding protein